MILKNWRISFRFGCRGLATAWHEERNFRIEILIMAVVVVCAWFFQVGPAGWIALTLAGGLVLLVELLNTATERIIDALSPRLDKYAREVKDIMAGAVILAALISVLVGLIVFIPRLFA